MDLSRQADEPTTATVAEAPRRSAIVARAVTTSLLALFVLAGLFGLLGERSSLVSAADGSRELALTYPAVVRAGMNAPWQIELRDPAGLPQQVDLEIDASYFDLYEHQRFYPEPAEESRHGDIHVMTFDTGGETSLVITHDAYVQPRYSASRSGSITYATPGQPSLAVQFRTVVLP
ncbi:MAG: hypothetical protein M3Y20_05135 [Actinomycetota bacterium]|nr:hypothetical protein [Actinomycetota bacterium]